MAENELSCNRPHGFRSTWPALLCYEISDLDVCTLLFGVACSLEPDWTPDVKISLFVLKANILAADESCSSCLVKI